MMASYLDLRVTDEHHHESKGGWDIYSVEWDRHEYGEPVERLSGWEARKGITTIAALRYRELDRIIANQPGSSS
jgi:hypothetical protein